MKIIKNIFIIRGCHLVWEIIFYSLYYTPYFIFLLYYISLYIIFLILYSIPYIIFLILYPYYITRSFILYSLYYIPIIFLYIIFYGYYIISYSSLSVSIICGIDLSNLFTIDLLLTLYIINTHRWYARLHSPLRH